MPLPTAPAVSAPASTFAIPNSTGSVPLHPTADAPFEERWAAWQARGRVHEAAARRRALIGAPVVALVATGLYLLLGR